MTSSPSGTSFLNRLINWWPPAAGFGVALPLASLMFAGVVEPRAMAQALTSAGFVYVGAAAAKRRGAAWPMLGASLIPILFSAMTPGSDSVWWMLGASSILIVVGLMRALRPAWGFPLQALAMGVILAIAFAVVALRADLRLSCPTTNARCFGSRGSPVRSRWT